MSKDQLRAALETLPFETEAVAVSLDGRRLIAVVVAQIFEGMNEAARQRLVWNHLHATFDVEELVPLEFVFTNSPAESKELAS
jgi:acid stress-induced BolA-like protein IbaG/YrbA